jgi:hypothetical protein
MSGAGQSMLKIAKTAVGCVIRATTEFLISGIK